MKKIILVIMVMAWFITGCSTFPKDDIKIETEAAAKVDFSGYKTYAWLGAAGILYDPHGHWEPPALDADAEMVFLVNSALRDSGMTEVMSEPDMLVAYALGADMEALKLKQNPETKLTSLENVPQIGLVVVLIDSETGFVTWVGIATGEIKNLDSEIVKKRLEYAVNAMFNELPK